MTRQIDTDAVIDNIRLKEQAADPSTPATGYYSAYVKAGGLYWIDDAGVVSGPIGTGLIPQGRLTLTTATPVTTADVTGAATLYYTPYTGDIIELYDGARWIPVVFTEKSLSLVGYTASKPYDIWGYLSSGTLALESTIWTDGTTRATALAYQNGRLIKSGTATRRYLGTIYINSSGAQTDDSATKRNVFNYYNRLSRRLARSDATGHTYDTPTWRAWNNDTAQTVEFMVGVAEDPTITSIKRTYFYTSATDKTAYIGLGLDVTNNVSTDYAVVIANHPYTTTTFSGMATTYTAVGRHYLCVVQYGSAATCSFGQYYFDGSVMG